MRETLKLNLKRQCSKTGVHGNTRDKMPLQPIPTNAVRPRLKPGRKPKPVEDRTPPPSRPVQRVERTYSRQRKIEVVLFLMHHFIPTKPLLDPNHQKPRIRSGDLPPPLEGFRRPTYDEGQEYWKIPRTTIIRWWGNRDSIV